MSSDMSKEHLQTCFLILSLVKTALGTEPLYVVTDAYEFRYSYRYGPPDGIYEEKRGSNLFYKKLGEADSDRNNTFLYTDSRRPNSWILGEGGNVTTAVASYRATAVEGRPSVAQWSYVHDGMQTSGCASGCKHHW